MRIVFSHGKESGPWGTKISRLAEEATNEGLAAESIDYRGLAHPGARVDRLRAHLERLDEPVVLAGSSMGGYVSSVVASERPVAGLFLLAPALFVGGDYEVRDHRPKAPAITVVHGWEDELIPWRHSVDFARENGATLHLLPDGHRLNANLDDLAVLFQLFLHGLERP